MRLRDMLKADDGTTLAELLVVTALLGVILTAAFAGMTVINKSSNVSAAASVAASDMSNPLEMISRMVMQNNGFDVVTYPTGVSTIMPSPYQLYVWTNPTLSSNPELDAFYATSSGQLVWERWKYDSTKTTASTHVRWVMSTNNANVAQNVPLFTYYDSNSVLITNMANVPSYARYVVARTVSTTGSGATYTDSRTILFRNRN